ncbi:MAG: hypothetical protein K0R85_1025 [Devosia sp.]|jgi:hypothetical protein|nr:hypothetical protein [Devosia sp.]
MNASFPKLTQRKFFLHTGASKTGTTALQEICVQNHQRLLDGGVWYPLLDGGNEYKQQWLTEVFLTGNRAAFELYLQRMEAACPVECHTIFLSSEGLSYHFQRFPAKGHQLFKEFIRLFNPHCLFVTRPRDEFLVSLYKQAIINPRMAIAREYATDDTFEQWSARPYMRNLSSPKFLPERFQAYFGSDRYTELGYTQDITKRLLTIVLGSEAPVDWEPASRANVSLSTAEAELVRLLNGVRLDNDTKAGLIARFKCRRLGQDVPCQPDDQIARLVAALSAIDTRLAQSSSNFTVTSGEVETVKRALLAELSPGPMVTPIATADTVHDEAPARVLFACVADDSHKYMVQAVRLVESLRWFGGRLADAPFLVGMIEHEVPDYSARLKELGATVQVIPRFSPLHGPSNKLSMIEWVLTSVPPDSYDVLVLLDCDTVIVQDPSAWLAGGALRAKMADASTIPHAAFQAIFEHFGVPMPSSAYRTNPGDQATIWYCNAGVLSFPREVLQALGPRWLSWNRRLLDALHVLGPHRFFCEQASLSLAFAEEEVPFAELPLEMNYPMHFSAEQMPRMKVPVDPVLVHYHDRLTPDGLLPPGPNPACQMRVAAYNARVRLERRRHFDGWLFWNFHYAHADAPKWGSIIDSGGTEAEYKRDLLKHVMVCDQPTTILDVGCGNLYVGSVLPAAGYTGIDISSAIVDVNRERYPERRFECIDFLAPDHTAQKTEAVVCLDVLSHIASAHQYQEFVRRLLEATERVGIVAGYEAPPENPGDITFFHEPLSRTLARYGAHSLQPIGRYSGGTVIWRYGAFGTSTLSPMDMSGQSRLFVDDAIQSPLDSDAEVLRRQIANQQEIIESQSETITQLLGSTSWKITASLRALMTRTRQFARKPSK